MLPNAASAFPLRRAAATFTASAPRDTLLVLPQNWIVLDSLIVLRNGEPQSEFAQWRVVEPGNRLWIYRPLGPQDTLWVVYYYRPFPLLRSYVRRSLRELGRELPGTADSDTTRIVTAPPLESPVQEGWSRLNKSGSLIRSVQVGTGQDLEMESALNLQIQGRVGKNVDVVAALTDQSTPIQPEGTTEAINELEKIFVSVRSPHLATTLGDYNLNLLGGQYDTYARKLTGVMGEANYSHFSATASGAVSRGQFYSYSFTGQEANQGPYPLPGRTGEIGIVVLAGTEKVWLDGELLRRGEGNDYTIDYAAGEITFTSRRIITSDSRLVVDYEYSNEDYERFYAAGRADGKFGDDRLGGTFTWITESDDRARPINIGLTDADRDVLAAAGDDPNAAVVFAADSIGIAGGDYVQADTSWVDSTYSLFRFSPRDSLNQPTGQWRVLFDDFGVGNGEYAASADSLGLTFFYWVGPGAGRYRPYRRLPLPAKQNLADFRLHTSPAKGLQISGEIASSQRDVNTFSNMDDGDNNGMALTGAIQFSRDDLKLIGITPHRIIADTRVRHRDRQFVEMSRSSEVEFNREWDTQSSSGVEETIREATLRLNPIEPLSVYGGYGDLDRPDRFASQRRNIGLSARVLKSWQLSADHLSLQSQDSQTRRRGNWIRQNAGLIGTWTRFAPRVRLERERKRDRIGTYYSGYRYLDYLGGMGVVLPGNVTMDSEYRRRTDDRLTATNAFTPASRAYTMTTEATWSPPEQGRISARYAHREKDYSSLDSTDVVSDIGRLEALLLSQNRLFEANVVYEVAKTRSQNQLLVAVEVPEGTGSYRREGDQYIPDDQGNYELVPRFTGVYEPATEVTLNSLFWLRPDELNPGAVGDWLRALSSETELVIEERTRKSLSPALLMLDQSQFRGDSTLWGTVSLRQDLHVRRLSQKLSTRLRYRYSQSLQNQYLNGGQGRTVREGGIRVRAKYLSFWRGETETNLSRETQQYFSGTFPDRDINRFELSQGNTIILSSRWETGLDVDAVEANDERTATQVSLRELRPHVALNLVGKARFDANVSWIHATSNKAAIPYELSRGSNRGENYRWSLRGTYQFGQMLSGSLNYTGRQDAGEKTYHTGRLEVRATF